MYLFYCPLFSIVCVCLCTRVIVCQRGKYEENRGESRVEAYDFHCGAVKYGSDLQVKWRLCYANLYSCRIELLNES